MRPDFRENDKEAERGALAQHETAESDRRKFRRIRAPLYCRPAGMGFLAKQRQPIDVSLGGVRIYSDDPLKVGELLKLEFFLEGTDPVTYTAQVVWIEPLSSRNAPARYDVGLKFLHLEAGALKLLVSVLGPLEEDEAPNETGQGEPNAQKPPSPSESG